MRIISLNTLGGALYEPLMQFIAREASHTDAFCFQEMYRGVSEVSPRGVHLDLFEDLSTRLSEFVGSFAPAMRSAQGRGEGGDAMFVRRDLSPAFEHRFIVGSFDVSPLGDLAKSWPIILQWAAVGDVSIANVHGIPQPGDKLDSPLRVAQTDAMVAWVLAQQRSVVLCGDFNLMPQTQSIAKLEQVPLVNLIKEHGIERTRPMSHLMRYSAAKRQYFADYAFVSPQLAVAAFEVPDIEISDHLPLIIELA